MPETEQKWIQIARAGTFTDSAGRPQTFTPADLSAIAAAYKPEQRDAPLVFGHPQTNAPAFGWVDGLRVEGEKLFARFAHVPGQVRDLVAKHHYRHVSMSLMPDRVALRHVGLLGAAQPAIDGLGAVELASGTAADNNAICIEFTEPEPKEAPVATMEELQQQVGALTEQINALKAENTKLKAEQEGAEGDKAEAEKKAADTAAEFAAYKAGVTIAAREKRVLDLVNAGKLEPGQKDGELSYLAALAEVPRPVNFAADDGTTQEISAEERRFRELEARPASLLNVNFAALAPAPAHARQDQAPAFTPADITAKL